MLAAGQVIATGLTKLGAILGAGTRIGAKPSPAREPCCHPPASSPARA